MAQQGVYNMNPLVSTDSLYELIFADTGNGRHGMTRPDSTAVNVWLGNLGLLGCNESFIYGSYDNTGKSGVIGIGGGCPSHGSCIGGICVCDEGYVYSDSTNTCFEPGSSGSGFHLDPVTGVYLPDRITVTCDDSDRGKTFPYSYLVWNGQDYAYPDGFTNQDLCWIGDTGCGQSICRWLCKNGYVRAGSVCVPDNAARFIPDSEFNRLILPDISRQDVSLEPVPGVPSFAPVLKAGFYYNAEKELKAGWHLELPRVEFNISNASPLMRLDAWDQKTVYVYMPWGKEEYSVVSEKKCYNSNEAAVPCGDPYSMSDISSVKITLYPAPGQNLFSYIVLETTGKACENSFGDTDGRYFESAGGRGMDRWKITRYGDDGSVTEFLRNDDEDNLPAFQAPRPASYRFMDYIPVSKHTTRDLKETSFRYEWDRAETAEGEYSHYNLRAATITDPLKRVIKITSSDPELSGSEIPEYGLTGKPDAYHTVLYKPLEGTVTIYTGRADAVEALKKVAEYSDFDGFSMKASVYKDEHYYRADRYFKENGIFYLNSYTYAPQPPYSLGTLSGSTSWEFTEDNGDPYGYIERKLIKDSSEYAVKTVKGRFYNITQEIYSSGYSLSHSGNYKTTAIYSEADKKRIVEDYFTNWLQPAERVTCERGQNEADNCGDAANTVREEIKYNVSGSPVYFKNADNQITLNLYDINSETNAESYYFHFYSDPVGYTNFDLSVYAIDPNLIKADNLHKSGTLACSAVYSLDSNDDILNAILLPYTSNGIIPAYGWCDNTVNRRVTNYEWRTQAFGKPYDLQTVTYPDGKTKTFTYDYETTTPSGYTDNGKVWGETVTGSNNQNTLQTCYEYNNDYQLVAQGIGLPGSDCNKKKGFAFGGEGGLLMIQDYSFDENDTHVLENDYIYDSMGRKIAERNSAGVSTLYVYDSLDRVVFTFFGCNVDTASFATRVYAPYNFEGDDLAGENGRGVGFNYHDGEFPYARYINLTTCEYYRKYKYDVMSNLTETFFFEYWGINANNQIVKDTANPKIIKQTTEYDNLGRAVKSCQFDGTITEPEDDDKRCIETEHNTFGNIVKKTENGEERIITYDLRNRPLTVTVDGLPTEEYSYSNSASGGYFGSDTIKNKYGNISLLTTYKDKWGRAAKQVDPFGNETVTTYESDYSDNITSQITTSSNVKTGETVWTYDDLDRKLSETRKQFIPGSESTTNVNHVTWWEYDSIGNVVSVESSDGTKQSYSYDSLNRPVGTVNYEEINSNWVMTSSVANSYDIVTGRLSSTSTTRNSQTITEDYGFDTLGRVTSVKTTDSSTQNPQTRYRLKFYNTGGQVIWEADEETKDIPYILNNFEVGNEKYYTYNAFGDLEKTVYVMTNSGKGRDSLDLNPWLNNSQITTNFEYDIFGRIKKRINDRSGVTEYNYYTSNTTGSHSRNKLESIQIFPALTNGDTDFYDNESVAQTYTYTYDDKGDEASVEYTDGNNYSMLVSFTRDDYGRITGKTSYGSVPVTQTFTYNNRNLLETATDTVGNAAPTSVTRLFDSFGNPYSEAVSANNITKTVSRRMTDAKTYQFTYPDGKIVRKTATGSDLDSIEYGTTGNLAELAAYSRANGVLTAITKGQNLTETFSYNNWNLLDNHTVSNANADVYDMSYNYSRGWHLVEKADGIKNTSDKYTYDSYYRLKEVKYDFANNTATRTDSFYQDGVHNIEQSTENGVTYAWGVDKLNRLRDKKVGGNTAVTYKYDKRNNMIGEDFDGSEPADISYIYDDLNRLIEVKDGSNQTIATYTYDAFNRRITKTVGSTTERYTYDDWDIVEISTNSDDYTNIIDSGMDRHIAIEVTANNVSTLYYFLTDERGNVTALTDANGNVLERYRYRVYGDFEILDSQFTPKNCNNQTCYATNLHNFLWGGSLYEPETGLYWMRNRYYHPDMHRFINQDPIGIWGDANNLGNGFAYVAGMVIEASDPSGLEIYWDSNWITEAIQSGLAYSETFSNLYFVASDLDTDIVIIVSDLSYEEIEEHGAAFADYLNCEAMQTTLFTDYMSSKADYMSSDGIMPIGGVFVIYVDSELARSGKTDTSYGEVPIEGVLGHEFGHTGREGEGMIKVPPADPDPAVEEQNRIDAEMIKEELKKNKKDEYSVDPDSSEDKNQSYFANHFIKKILEMHEKKNFLETMEEEGPVIKYDDNGRKIFFFNPYYRGKDPMKEIIWETQNADGTRGFVRNPFAPGTEYGYDATTYEKWQQSGFPQTNVDPYWQ